MVFLSMLFSFHCWDVALELSVGPHIHGARRRGPIHRTAARRLGSLESCHDESLDRNVEEVGAAG